MSRHVVFDCERMKYPNNGLFSYCKQLGNALLQQKPPDCRLAFYIPEKQKGFFGKKEEYVVQNHLHKFFPKNVRGYNIWHCTFQGSNYFPARRMRARVVATIHDLNFLHEGIPADQQNKHRKKIQQLIERAEKIVAISNFVKNDIINTFNVNNGKVEVIYHGHNKPVVYDEFTPPSIAYNKPFFFALGTINRKKNFHVLPAMLLKNDYDLVIAGGSAESDYEALIVETAGKLGVRDRVKIIGAITESEKYWLYKNCTAFCLPSQAEGFGAPVLEAMQFGTPVILSKATSLPEIGGPHAFYFNDFSTDAVSQTADNFLNLSITPEIRKRLIDWASQFSWSASAEKYWDLYQEILY